ncbi:MAG: hypothetical protein EOO38_16530 [Cytophagaceae bacterium]|nr:MAG: hypothetical protein EOO38_16530 [Cytophagaceae bacterium]
MIAKGPWAPANPRQTGRQGGDDIVASAAAGQADTFPKLLLRNARERGGRVAFRHKDLGIWQSWTWAEVAEQVRAYARGLEQLGLKRGEKVAIIGYNRPRLYWSMAAAQWLGAVPVPVYADSVADVLLNTTKPVYVVDNHVLDSALSGAGSSKGNCSGSLDTGEIVILYPNLENTGSIKGGMATELVSNSSNVKVLAGGEFGFFYRLKAATTFRAGELNGMSHVEGSNAYKTFLARVLPPSFIVQATGSGVASLSMKVTMMDTITGLPQTQNLPISLTIGSIPTQSSCSTDVWP